MILVYFRITEFTIHWFPLSPNWDLMGLVYHGNATIASF